MKYLINITKLIRGRAGMELYILLSNLDNKIKSYFNDKKSLSKTEYIIRNTIFKPKEARK